MAPSPTQLAWRARIEGALRLAAPGLDLLLAFGDRASRLADREPPGAVLPAPGVARVGGAGARRAVGRGAADEAR